MITRFFDKSLYLSLYPEVKAVNVNPLLHYLYYGRSEKRFATFNAKTRFIEGQFKYDDQKPLFVVVSHTSSSTGAPLVGFNLGKELSKKYNVINLVLNSGKLQKAFEKECVGSISDFDVASPLLAKRALQYLMHRFGKITGVICNSIETTYVLEAANQLNLPAISLIHEFACYSQYQKQFEYLVKHTNKIVVPAKVIADSISAFAAKSAFNQKLKERLVTQAQGRLPNIPEGHGDNLSIEQLKYKLNINSLDDVNIIIGAGTIDIRKGVDLFISTADNINKLAHKPCKFVWVGEGTDTVFYDWLKTQIAFYNLEDDFVFLPQQRNLENILQLANVFCLTSRLDPFPNVVIDALAADVHVACFEQCSGSADFLKRESANFTLANHLNVADMAAGVTDYLNQQQSVIGVNQKIAESKCSFENYARSIISQFKST